MIPRIVVLTAVVLAACLASCARTEVKTRYETTRTGLPRPRIIVVRAFEVDPGDVRRDGGIKGTLGKSAPGKSASVRDAEHARDLGRRASDLLADRIVQGIGRFLPAQRAEGHARLRRSLLVDGTLVSLDEGSRIKRLAIGFGAGKSRAVAHVEVFEGNRARRSRKVLDFTTSAESSIAPGVPAGVGVGLATGGAAVVVAGVAAASGGVREHGSSVEKDIQRMADEIVARLSRFFAAQGWIAPQQAVKDLPLGLGPPSKPSLPGRGGK